MGHARALLSLAPQQQLKIAQAIVKQRLSVRQTESLVAATQDRRAQANPRVDKVDPNIQNLQENLSDHLGAVVAIKHRSSGRGELVIKYHSNDELSGILEKIIGELSFS
jgi:ParB family chromosome partitioning protein